MHYLVKPRGGCITLLSLGEVYLSCFNKPRGGFYFYYGVTCKPRGEGGGVVGP